MNSEANTNFLRATVRKKINLFREVKRFLNITPSIGEAFQLEKAFRKQNNNPAEQIHVRIKQIANQTVYCRKNHIDVDVLWDSFFSQFHVSPVELKQDATIFDLGSNVGYTIVHFKYLYPDSTIIGVELDDENYKLCVRNAGELKNVHLVNAAVWIDENGIEYDASLHAHSFAVSEMQEKNSFLKKASSVTIESLIKKYNISKIDYLKMDIEGAEKNIFRLDDLNWLNIVSCLKIEVHPTEYYDECFKILSGYGFYCYKDTHHWSTLIAIKDKKTK